MFLINRGEIEGRLDVGFYKPEIIEFLNWLKNKSHTHKLKTFIKSMRTGFNNCQNENQHGLRFLRTQNIRPIYLDFQDATFTTDETVQIAKKGTLLFTRIGVNVGDVSFNNVEDFAISDNVICVDLQNEILAYYVAIFLSTEKGKILLEREKRDTARAIISYENIKNLLIPILPTDKQAEIISIFETAYHSKKQKETEAAQLLVSIDGYLLKALGITLPPTSEKKTFFITNSSKISGGRFDPFYHLVEFEQNNEVVKNGIYPTTQLKQIAQKLVKGKLPKDSEKVGLLNVIQINSISFDGHIDTSDLLTAQDIFTPEQRMQKDDVLVVITGATIGKIAIWEQTENENYFLGGDIVKFQCVKNANPYFIFAWLRCHNSQIEIKRNVTGATNGHLSPSDIGNILIPFPPLDKQTEIADHISALRLQARQLQHEAQVELERAKIEVERMILGEKDAI